MDGCGCKEKCLSCQDQLLQNELQLRANNERIAQLQLENATLKAELRQANAYFHAQHKVLCERDMEQVLKMVLSNLDGVDLCRVSGVCKQCKQLKTPNGRKFGGRCLAISSRHIFIQKEEPCTNMNIYVYCTETGDYSHQLQGQTTCVAQLLLTKMDTVAVTRAYGDSVVRVWNIESGELIHAIQLPNSYVEHVIMHNCILAIKLHHDTLTRLLVFDVGSGQMLQELNGQLGWSYQFDIGVQHILTCGGADNVKLWGISDGVCRFSWPTAHAGAHVIMIMVVNLKSGQLLCRVDCDGAFGYCESFQPILFSNGLLLTKGQRQGQYRIDLWDITNRRHVRKITDCSLFNQWFSVSGSRLQYVGATSNKLLKFVRYNFGEINH